MLLPELQKLTKAAAHEDEVLCKFADTLNATFLPLVGGPVACFPMIQVLLPLACATETAVRSRSVASLVTLVAAVPGAGTSDEKAFAASAEWANLKKFLEELSGPKETADEETSVKKADEPWFPSKLSSCTLYPAVYACLPAEGMNEEKAALLEMFKALSADEMPMVRATAVGALAGLSKSVTMAIFQEHLQPIFVETFGGSDFKMDSSDVVREAGVRSMTAYLDGLAPVAVTEADLAAAEPDTTSVLAEVVTKMTDLFLQAADDTSWRVRLAVVNTVHMALKPADAKRKGEILAAFAELLDDEEADVKLAATKNTANVFKAASYKEMFDRHVLPTVEAGFNQMLEAAKAAAEGGPGADVGKNDLRQAQATSAMELAQFDAIPHPTLIAVVHHMFEETPLCIKMLEKFELLAKLKESDPAALTTICMDSLALNLHEDWRVRCAFTAKLAFIFEQIISVESSAAHAAAKEAAGSGGAAAASDAMATPKKDASPRSTPSTPLDKDAVAKAWDSFKKVVDVALWDQVAEARVHFVDCLPKLITWADKIGSDKYVKELIAMLVDQYKSAPGVPIPGHPERKMSYLYKISVLAGIGKVLEMDPAPTYFNTPSNVTELHDILIAAAKDPTPNTRLVAGKALRDFALACCMGKGASPGSLQTVEMSLMPALQTMAGDSDMDVKSVAQEALTATTEALKSAN